MINEIYTTITIALASALFVLGMLFYSLNKNSKTPIFRTVLLLMISSYCIFGFANVMELYGRIFLNSNHILLFQIVSLIVGASQAFLFTFTLVLLIRVDYVTRKRVLRELIPILTLSLLLVAAYVILPVNQVKIAIRLFTIFYVWLLFKYIRIFITSYSDYQQRLDNFFSHFDAEHLKWVKSSFFAALNIGVLALINSIFPAILIGVFCSVTYLIFYVYFACRLINYGNVYKKLMVVLANDNSQCEQPEDSNMLQPTVIKNIEAKLKKWLDKKLFLQTSITIDDVARQIQTNRSYLSKYINSTERKPFRQWINELRIDYAKHLLNENPQLELWQIAEQAGYTDSKNFSTQFKKITGKTPSEYRKNKINSIF